MLPGLSFKLMLIESQVLCFKTKPISSSADRFYVKIEIHFSDQAMQIMGNIQVYWSCCFHKYTVDMEFHSRATNTSAFREIIVEIWKTFQCKLFTSDTFDIGYKHWLW